MFRTVLLETGNWTDAGRPTGRRVTFTNSFATAGHYFNFSTSGQWLWDELSVMVPYDRDPHAVADAIQKEVTAATAPSTAQAEQEWRAARAARAGGVLGAAGSCRAAGGRRRGDRGALRDPRERTPRAAGAPVPSGGAAALAARINA